MSFDPTAVMDALASVAQASGHFDAVDGHEPKSAPPGTGLTYAVWVDQIRPVAAASGLAATSAALTFALRIYTPFVSEPQDAIDPAVITATWDIMTAITADFSLGGLVRNVDVFGAHGEPFGSRAGYLNLDGKIFRVMTITLPVVVSDAFPQAE